MSRYEMILAELTAQQQVDADWRKRLRFLADEASEEDVDDLIEADLQRSYQRELEATYSSREIALMEMERA
jgi:hypothetical protein